MKKTSCIITLIAGIMIFSATYAQTDYRTSIIGTWQFDLGGGMSATIEFKPDGKLIQKVSSLIINGAYTIEGDKMQTSVGQQITAFTIVSLEGNKLTMKRDKDNRVIVYTKQ